MFSWQANANHTTQLLRISDTSDLAIKNAVEASAEKIISLLHDIILDDSLYLIFEWDKEHSTLTASVTDAGKKNDAEQHIRCEFSGLNLNFKKLESIELVQQQVDMAEHIKFLLQDYLASCTAFFQFSLVAIFHADTRARTELL